MRYGGLIAAIIFAAIAAVIVLRMSGGEPAPAVAPGTAEVKAASIYVAKTAVPVGDVITKEMVDPQPWPEHLLLEGFIRADGKTDIVGMVARAPFQKGEPFIATKLSNPNDPNFLAGDLPAGMRIVSVKIDEVGSVAGFVFPGDFVDVIYTHDVERWETLPNSQLSRAVKDTVTETLVTNVKVLAVGQRSSNIGATDKKGNLIVPKSASLMVSQADAQRILLAQKTGNVSLALRSLADRQSADPLILTEKKDVSQFKNSDGETVNILRGAPVTTKDIIAIETAPATPATMVSRGAETTSGPAPLVPPTAPAPIAPAAPPPPAPEPEPAAPAPAPATTLPPLALPPLEPPAAP